jgi:hypothetical protein
MATVSATKDSIKTDVRELANIATEDKISRQTIKDYHSLAEIHYKEALEDRLKHDLLISDITDINRVSRFVDKLLFVLSRYQQNEERTLILHCVYLMVEDSTKKS